jgi:hypothetical protein
LGDPIESYLKNMENGKIFNTNQYGDAIIQEFALIDNSTIVVITSIPSDVKSFALAKIVFNDGYYIHESLGTFITYEGAEKQFALARGLEWAGDDSFDDYC